MNCDTLANPLHPSAKKMKELTSLKIKQDEHHLAISKLQWLSSLYYDDEIGIYLSSKMIKGSLKASAKKEKKGMQTKAIIVDCLPGTPLLPYQGKKLEDLWQQVNKKGEQIYAHTEAVNVKRTKVMKTRPIFNIWEAKFEILLDTEILSESDFKRILERAGYEYGFGDLRPQMANGIYGKFKLEDMKEI